MSRWDSISITAHYTGQIWVRAGMPWSWPFDTWRGRAMYDLSEPLFNAATRAGLNTPLQFCLQRHRILDHLVELHRPAQIVELAGGLSPRSLAFSQKLGIPCLDVDLPDMVAFKAHLLGGRAPASYQQRPLDLIESDDYVADLGEALQRVSPTIVVTEGLLPYFDAPRRQHIFEQIAALLRWCGGGAYLTDMHHQEAVDRMGPVGFAFRTALHHMTDTVQATLIQDMGEGREVMTAAGFDRVNGHEPGDYVDSLGVVVKDRSSGLSIYEALLDG